MARTSADLKLTANSVAARRHMISVVMALAIVGLAGPKVCFAPDWWFGVCYCKDGTNGRVGGATCEQIVSAWETFCGGAENTSFLLKALSECIPSACCLADDECVIAEAMDCTEVLGGTFLGDGTTCEPSSCPAPFGSCCSKIGCFDGHVLQSCDMLEGVYGGDGSDCSIATCMATVPTVSEWAAFEMTLLLLSDLS